MDISAESQMLLKKVYAFYRLTISDSDKQIQTSMQEILHLWPDVLAAGDRASDDELFVLNVSRAVLTQVFSIALSKEFFYRDQVLIRDIFCTCFHILTTYADIFRKNDSNYIDSNVRLLIKMITSVSSFVSFEKADLTKIEDQHLLIAMREHIDHDYQHDNLTDGIISFIWNLSDRTLLIPVLLNAGYAESVIQWIQTREAKFRDDKIDAPVHILHNLARHDDGIYQLNQHHALDIVDGIDFHSHLTDNDMTIHLAMIRALLSGRDQIQNETKKYPIKVVNMLIQLAIDAAKNERFRSDGSHVSEPLTVLVKLFSNEQILDNSFSNSTIQAFIELFTDILDRFRSQINVDNDPLDNYTCVVIFNLFDLIYQRENYRTSIRTHEPLMKIVKDVVDNELDYVNVFMPRTMRSVKETAKNILNSEY